VAAILFDLRVYNYVTSTVVYSKFSYVSRTYIFEFISDEFIVNESSVNARTIIFTVNLNESRSTFSLLNMSEASYLAFHL